MSTTRPTQTPAEEIKSKEQLKTMEQQQKQKQSNPSASGTLKAMLEPDSVTPPHSTFPVDADVSFLSQPSLLAKMTRQPDCGVGRTVSWGFMCRLSLVPSF